MHKRNFLRTAAAAAALCATGFAFAQGTPFKIGLILPMTGQQATTGRQIEAAAKLWMAQNGDTVAGRKIQLIVRDDTSVPAVTRRLAQELVVNDHVNVLAGMGITPSALAVAPIATQSDYAGMTVPSVWRTNRTQAAARVDALASGGMDDFEIPAFLRKQAD